MSWSKNTLVYQSSLTNTQLTKKILQKYPKKNHAKNYISILGTPEAVITWGHGERFLTNGTLILNLWDTEYFQVNIYFT